MTTFAFGASAPVVQLISDEDYGRVVKYLIQASQIFCYSSLFIVDLLPARDPRLYVASVLDELASAEWRGVDVRLLIGGSRQNIDIHESAAAAGTYARSLGIPTRVLSSKRGCRGSHVKLVVADEWLLTGSHNWSGLALSGQTQDSVLVHSAALAAWSAHTVLEQWNRVGP